MFKKPYQLELPAIDVLLRLSEVERELSRVINPLPDRKTIIGYIEDGTLNGKKIGRGGYYYVYRSSLETYIRGLQTAQ